MVEPCGAPWFYWWFYLAPLDGPWSTGVDWALPPGTRGAEASGPAPPTKITSRARARLISWTTRSAEQRSRTRHSRRLQTSSSASLHLVSAGGLRRNRPVVAQEAKRRARRRRAENSNTSTAPPFLQIRDVPGVPPSTRALGLRRFASHAS